jgi:hypothetical protein
MQHDEIHLSDQILLLAAEGELSVRETAQVNDHLAACPACRARRREIADAISEFTRDYRRSLDSEIPPPEGPRALLRAQLAERSRGVRSVSPKFSWAIAGFAAMLALAVYLASPWWMADQHVSAARLMIPDPGLTPGATILMTRDQVCRATSIKNKPVSSAVEREVLKEYGIGTSRARTYEVDYLITPALGGADDIHNLWPESYEAIVWNAHIKDQLEDYLRDRVCAGTLDLATAQRDLAVNWIDAYKRYFHTEQPLDGARLR